MKKIKDNLMSLAKRGPKNPMYGKRPWNYKGGTVTRSGSRNVKYIEVRVAGKRLKMHRYIIERIYHRKLGKNEVVHHIDGNGLNNDINNLQILKRGEHSKIHADVSYLRR